MTNRLCSGRRVRSDSAHVFVPVAGPVEPARLAARVAAADVLGPPVEEGQGGVARADRLLAETSAGSLARPPRMSPDSTPRARQLSPLFLLT